MIKIREEISADRTLKKEGIRVESSSGKPQKYKICEALLECLYDIKRKQLMWDRYQIIVAKAAAKNPKKAIKPKDSSKEST